MANAQPARYPAQAFHKELPKGKSAGELTVDNGSVTFVGGGRTITLPFAGLSMTLGGASNRLVFLAHPHYPDWSIYTGERAILRDRNLTAHPELTRQASQARRTHRLAWSLLVAATLLVLAVPALLLFRMDLLTREAARHVPVAWEQNLGKSAMAQYGLGTELMDDARAQQLLAPVLAPLLPQLAGDRHRYHFSIANDTAINAFALPGGEVVINAGLILKADRDSELLGVLAHEITHVREQHGVRAVMGSTGIYLVVQALVGDASGLLAAVAGAAPLFINQSYSRAFEREADRGGVALLAASGVDPAGMVEFFGKLRAEEEKQLAKIDDERARDAIRAGMQVLGSHPATSGRMADLRALIAKVPTRHWHSNERDMAALKAAVAAFATRDQDNASAAAAAATKAGEQDER